MKKSLKKITTLSIFIILSIVKTSQAQKNIKDSLKIDSMTALYFSNEIEFNIDGTIARLNNALAFAKKINYKWGIRRCYSSLGMVYRMKGDRVASLESYTEWIKLSNDLNATKKSLTYSEASGISNGYVEIARIYMDYQNYDKAVEYYVKAEKVWGKVEKTSTRIFGLSIAYSNLANCYHKKKDFNSSIDYYKKAINISTEPVSIPPYYISLGQIYMDMNNLQKAMENFKEALRLTELWINEKTDTKIPDLNMYAFKIYLAECYKSIGLVFNRKGDYAKALENFSLAKQITMEYKTEDFNSRRSIIHLEIGKVYEELKNYSEAIAQIDSSISLEKGIKETPELNDRYEALARIYKRNNDFKNAFQYLTLFNEVKDSLHEKETTKMFAQFQTEEETLQKNRKIDLQEAEIKLNALKYEYDKKQATAKTEKERQQLKYELEIQQNKIEYDFLQKMATVEAERKQHDAIEKLKQEKKDAFNKQELRSQRILRNSIATSLAVALFFLVIVYRQRNKVKKEKSNVEIEKGRSEALLLNILPEEIANELKQNGETAAKQYNHVTVLFTDFVNFTGISNKLSPTELVKEIHKYFAAFDSIIERNGLEKIKTIGDAYLAVCGLPHETNDHAKRVVKAAIEILNYVQQTQGKFEIRIGVNSGPVVAGIVGIKKYAYDIWGDTVNTANRMEGNGEAGKVNISESTYELVKDQFNCKYRGRISAKGKGEIDMYFVES